MWRRERWGVLFFSFFVLPCALSQIQDPGRSASLAEEQDYSFAYGLYNDGLYQLASEQFDKFLKKYPVSVKRLDAFFLSVECRFQQQQFDTAAKLFARFLKEYPSSRLSDDANLRLGESYLRVRQPQLALPAFKKVLDDFGTSELAGEAAYWTGEAYVRMNDYENGIKYYMLAFEHYPDSRLRDYALYAIGWAYQTKGDYRNAIDWYKRLAKEFPKSSLIPPSLVRIGECHFAERDYRKAIDELTVSRQGISRPDEQGEAAYLIAEAHYHLAEYDKAARVYESFLADFPDHKLTRDVVYALGWAYLKLSNFQSAESAFDRIASGNDAKALSALFRRGVAEKLGGKPDEALATWREVAGRSPAGESTDNALYETGLISYERNDYAQALALFQRVIKEFPRSDVRADASRMLGECLVVRSDFAAAKEAFAGAMTIADASFDTKVNSLYQLGWCQFKLGQRREAVKTFSDFLADYPSHPKAVEARFWRAETQYQLGAYDASLNDYDAVSANTTSTKRAEALYGAGWSLYKSGNYKESAARFQRFVADFPSSPFAFDARVRTADCHFFVKDYAAAEIAYRTVLRQFPDRADRDYAMYQLGQSYFRLGNYDDALRQFQGLITGIPGSSLADDAQYAIGWLWFQGKNYDEAIKEFRTLVRSFPNSELVARAHYSIGDAYYNQQNYASAEQSYREVLSRFPLSPYVPDAISGIQYCLIAQGKQQEALKVIDSFVKENPGSPEAQGLLLKKGDLLFSQKEYDGAIREYRDFANRYAGSPLAANAHFWTGKSYEALGRTMDAASAYDQAARVSNAVAKIRSEAFLQAAEAYRVLKSYEKALDALAEAGKLATGPEVSSHALYLQGKVMEEKGDFPSALQKFNAVISGHSDSQAADKARIALARIYIREANYSDAQSLAERVATSRTDEIGAEAQYLVGLQFSQQGDWENAIPAYLRVRYVFPAHEEWLAMAYLGLGEAYVGIDDLRKAKEAYQNVVKMGGQRAAAAEAQKRLQRLERS